MNSGDGTLAERFDYPAAGRPVYVAIDDLDADGRSDLITANSSSAAVFWSRTDGTFEAPETFVVNATPHSVISADIEGDGYPEVITANASFGTLSVLLNTGNRRLDLVPSYSVGSVSRFVAAGDVNGDGAVDLVAANRGSRSITVLSNEASTNTSSHWTKVCTEIDFSIMSVHSGDSTKRVAKFLLPSREDARLLPPLFQNARRFPLHEEFLAAVFPDRFGSLTAQEYDQLVGRRATRDYFVGTISREHDEQGFRFSFTVVADTGFDAREVLGLAEVEGVYETLSAAFLLRPLGYRPDTRAAREEAETWLNPPFAVFSGRRELDYEAYTQATGYGRVRLLTLEEFEAANRIGRFTFQDILVVDQSPRDIDGVVGGVITGDVQGQLSHVAIRTARRGTPNAFVADALQVLSHLEGKLVRLEVLATEYFATEAPLAQAEAFWASNRPSLRETPVIDANYPGLDQLFEMDVSGAGGVSPVARFGGKATNLARLQQLLTPELEPYREKGFAIPIRYYMEFMWSNSRTVNGIELSYQEYLDGLLASPEFQSDSQARAEALEGFRDFLRENGEVDPALVVAIARRSEEVFGSTTRMVRFRSSSNVEDALEFNGAGLYESTSVCLADTLDEDDAGPSLCDLEQNNERSIERALKKVWASLWTFRAHEERTFFQIPPESSAMGILVTRAFLNEAANGVAFTGNPRNPRDRRHVVTAQAGEESVVSPEPGTAVERSLLEIVDGDVVRILRDRSSSLLEPGAVVMSDEQLRELGVFMWHVDQAFPLDLEGFARDQVLLDFEFKVEPDGALAVKQVRPFLLSEPSVPSPTFELEIPPGTVACGVFSDQRSGRDPRSEYEAKSTVRLIEGILELPTRSDTFSADLIEDLRFGPQELTAEPQGSGLFRISKIVAAGEQTIYRFNYEQQFRLPGGERFELRIFALNFRGRGDLALDRIVLDEEFLTEGLSMEGSLKGDPVVTYSSCTYELLPRWEVDVSLEGGSRIHLVERFLPSPNFISTGPASLLGADVVLEGERQSVADYWRLVYAARRHNLDVKYWIVLEPPLTLASIENPVRVLEVAAPQLPARPLARVSYLGEDFQVLGTTTPLYYEKQAVEIVERNLVRGDVNADGTLNLSDSLSLLRYLFQRGAVPPCHKSADANDDGRLNIGDAVDILELFFRNRAPLPEPRRCGVDPTVDPLSCEAYPACEE